MEITCNRCHQAVRVEDCYCPSCGLPQLFYSAEEFAGQGQAQRWSEAVGDASTVAWKPALRAALMLGVPAGLLCSGLSPVGLFGLFWMAAAAAWAVAIYVRSQRAPWITIGAGARIGLVTGILAAWLAFSVSGSALFARRFILHQSSQMDAEWKTNVEASQLMAQQWAAGAGAADQAQLQAARAQVQAWMLSPWGHAGIEVFSLVGSSLFLLFFAVGGGALGARLMARTRRPEA
jgi:hypothetical protein